MEPPLVREWLRFWAMVNYPATGYGQYLHARHHVTIPAGEFKQHIGVVGFAPKCTASPCAA